jgi:transcriptional regulator with XRE-family HTH domain
MTRLKREAGEVAHIPLLPKGQVSLITRFIGLGKSQVATLFGVSRQTLYGWLKGKIEPIGENAQRVALLARAMAPACRGLRRPLYHDFVTEAPTRGEASIIELLEQENWDERELAQAFQTARKLNDERAQQLGLGGRTVSRAVAENNMLDNSIAL